MGAGNKSHLQGSSMTSSISIFDLDLNIIVYFSLHSLDTLQRKLHDRICFEVVVLRCLLTWDLEYDHVIKVEIRSLFHFTPTIATTTLASVTSSTCSEAGHLERICATH